MGLIEKRGMLIAEHTAQEKYDPYWQAEAKAGRKLSERPIAFLCDDEVCVIGECVGKVLAALKEFIAHADKYTDRAVSEPAVRYSIAKIKKLVEDSPVEIRVSQQMWNAITFGLAEVNVSVILSDGR